MTTQAFLSVGSFVVWTGIISTFRGTYLGNDFWLDSRNNRIFRDWVLTSIIRRSASDGGTSIL